MRGFQPFQMERMLSRFEKEVEYNLSESGVHPVLLRELVDRENGYLQTLLDTDLNYPHTNGIPPLRQNIARLYQGGRPENVLVTVGAIEANYLVLKTLLAPGDEIVVMLPNYMQIWGLAKNHGLALKTFQLREETGWTPDLAELESVVTASTRLIAVCNPNNPTGSVLSESEMDTIVNLADRVGSWILADEVYAGAERLTDEETPSFYGRYDKALVTGSLSKAYGLPGLRIGWVVAPASIVDDIWARHEYTTISATMLSNQLAALALSPEVRPWLLRRTRSYIRRGYPVPPELDGSASGQLQPEAAGRWGDRLHSLPFRGQLDSARGTTRLGEECPDRTGGSLWHRSLRAGEFRPAAQLLTVCLGQVSRYDRGTIFEIDTPERLTAANPNGQSCQRIRIGGPDEITNCR